MSDDYSQPSFYRFNEDSLKLVRWTLSKVSHANSILDLGAGSGVIGIELSRSLLPENLTLLEVQNEFLENLRENVKKFVPSSVKTSIIVESFDSFISSEKFDLIVCNPPYYLPGKGRSSPDKNRAMARSFILDSWPVLLAKISQTLSATGFCFMVLKKDFKLFGNIEAESLQCNLSLERFDSGSLMFLSFRLNIK